jgi:hypothetical protein
VARCLERGQADLAELDDIAVRERRKRILGPGPGAEINADTGPVTQLQVAGDEVGVKMRKEDVLDSQAVFGREGEVLIDITLRIDDRCRVGAGVADEIRSVGQTIQIKLLQDHRALLRLPLPDYLRDYPSGCGTMRIYGLGDFQP